MEKEYDVKFNAEIERILKILYSNPLNSGVTKRAIISTDIRYIEYLEKMELAKRLNSSGGANFSLQLMQRGYEVYEKYNGWYDYYNKVIQKESKIDRAKNLAIKFWWLPVIISFTSLILAIIALIKSN